MNKGKWPGYWSWLPPKAPDPPPMKLADLEYIPHADLLAPEALFRIQMAKALPSTVRIGKLLLPPSSLMSGRFDIAGVPVGYFAEAPQTAAYEALCRREARVVSLAVLRLRNLACFQAQERLRLVDPRPHARAWPVLQSLRIAQTQELAHEIFQQGFAGVIYASAQQLGMDCFAIFGDALGRLRFAWAEALLERGTSNLHVTVAEAIARSRLTLSP